MARRRMHPAAAGAVAGVAARTVVAPIDVLKIRRQLGARGALQGEVRGLLASSGIRALWRGNVPGLLLYASYGGVQFGVFRKAISLLEPITGHAAASFGAGLAAASAATLATYPLDVWRTRRAAMAADGPPSAAERARMLAAPLRATYRGVGPALAHIAPYMAVVLGADRELHRRVSWLQKRRGGVAATAADAAVGGVAGAIGKTAVMPLDTLRRRMQLAGAPPAPYAVGPAPSLARLSAADVLRAIVRTEGVRALYAGLPLAVLKAAPAVAVSLSVFRLLCPEDERA